MIIKEFYKEIKASSLEMFGKVIKASRPSKIGQEIGNSAKRTAKKNKE